MAQELLLKLREKLNCVLEEEIKNCSEAFQESLKQANDVPQWREERETNHHPQSTNEGHDGTSHLKRGQRSLDIFQLQRLQGMIASISKRYLLLTSVIYIA